MTLNKKINQFLLHPFVQIVIWLQFAAALTIFSYFATTPNLVPTDSPDVVLHFLGNLLLFLSARIAFLRFKSVWFVVVFALIYGTAMELCQHFVPTRYFQPSDLVANWLGVFAGLLLTLLVEIIFNRTLADKDQE